MLNSNEKLLKTKMKIFPNLVNLLIKFFVQYDMPYVPYKSRIDINKHKNLIH